MTAGRSPSDRERMAVAIARELAGARTMLIGAASAVPLAAGLLAQALHTPGLTILGAGVYINPRRLVADLSAGWDCRPVAIGDMSDVFAITEAGIDVMFYGGMQIDRFGCVNLHRVMTSSGPLRGPGLANTTLGHTAKRVVLYSERHDRRTLVETVDYASVIGHAYRGTHPRRTEPAECGPDGPGDARRADAPRRRRRPDPRSAAATRRLGGAYAAGPAGSWARRRPGSRCPPTRRSSCCVRSVDPGGLLAG